MRPEPKIESCGCTDLRFMAEVAASNYTRYTANMAAVPRQVRRFWKTLDTCKYWPPHLQARLAGVTRRIGLCGEIMDAVAARWMLDHPK